MLTGTNVTKVTLFDYDKGITNDTVEVTNGKVINSSGKVASAKDSLFYTFPVVEGETYVISSRLSSYAIVFYENENVIKIYQINEIGEEINKSGIGTYKESTKSFRDWNIVIPSGIDRISVSCATLSSYGAKLEKKIIEKTEIAANYELILEDTCGVNVLNPDTVVVNAYLTKDGTHKSNNKYSYTDYIKVQAGDVIIPAVDGIANVRLQFVTAYDREKNVIPDCGAESKGFYVVPEGIEYVRVSYVNEIFATGRFAININNVMPYEAYRAEKLANGIREREIYEETMRTNPLTLLPDYMVNLLAYKPMQKPEAAYFCLVSDDGATGLATYTIPLCIEKEIPLTMAVMSKSEVFTDEDNAELYTTIVVDAVNNYGFEIAQHGGSHWTYLPEVYLNAFFDAEEAFFHSVGLSPKSAVAPAHYLSPYVQAVAGGRFGVVRSGYSGYDSDGNNHYLHNYYDYCTSGEGSNLYGLSSYNIQGSNLSRHKDAVDYAKENNKVLIYYLHENSLTDEDKKQIEAIIDYAKESGLKFVTLSELAYLNDGTIY